MLDWLVLRMPGWGRRVRRIRRDWNHSRERALKKKNPLRQMILQKLDGIETSLIMIEERPVGRFERKRMARDIEIVLAEVKVLLKTKEEDYATAQTVARSDKK